jgi:hypothetical protein
MMKKHRLILSLALLTSVTVFTGCKEDEVEKPVENTERVDALLQELRTLRLQVLGDTLDLQSASASSASLEAQIADLKNKYNQRVTYTLKAVNTQGELLSGATFTIAQGGSKVSRTSDASGAVVFENMRGGVVTGTVKVKGYTTANFTATLYKENNNYDEDVNNAYSIASSIPVIPAPGSNKDSEMFTIQGYLLANFNYNDDNSATVGPNPSIPAATYDTVSVRKIKAIFSHYEIPTTNNNGSDQNLLYLSYDSAVYESTVDAATKMFTLKVPARNAQYNNFEMYLRAEEFSNDLELDSYGNKVSRVYRIYFNNYENYGYYYSASNANGYINSDHNAGDVVQTKLFYTPSNF